MRGEFERSFAAGERARTLNPYDSNVLVELGARYVMRGLWDKGVPMLEEAYARNPALPSVWRSMLALYCYVHGRYREAIAEAKTAEATAFPWGPAVLAMAHVQLGEKREAEAAVNRILHLSPRFREEAAANLEMWHLHPDLIRAIIEGLRDAGLDVRT